VVVDYAVVESDAKTPKGRRSLALDPVTLAALKALHDIRHSYATAALAAGVPPKVISQRLGHDRDHDGHLQPRHPEPGRAGRRDGRPPDPGGWRGHRRPVR